MIDSPPRDNATFHAFRASGKWYASGRGHLPKEVFAVFERTERRLAIITANGGKFPGLNGPGEEFVFIVVADEDVDYGYPLMLAPGENQS
jgi:hypothetical protein